MNILSKTDNLVKLTRSYFSKKPSYLILFVTARCNARCKMCFYWKSIDGASKEKELTIKEYEKISKKFKNLFYISIGGGEPFVREDLAEIVYLFYKNSGTRVVNITTNGGFPERTHEIISRIFEKCPNINVKIGISLDAIGEKHDEIRCVKGIFNNALETYKLLHKIKNKDLAINIATTFSKLNKNSIYKIIDYVSENLNVNDQTITFVRGDSRDSSSKEVTPEDYFKVYSYLQTKQKNKRKDLFGIYNKIVREMYKINNKVIETNEFILPCVAGKKMITIDEEGNVPLCEMISYLYKNKSFNMGSLREFDYDINKILKRKKSKEILSFIEKSKCRCSFECATLCNIAFSKKKMCGVLLKK
ncbi:radical SAM protein [archaeon]|jgi:Fe-coproporphyrin III synthase|nr:radical SAM protein [archaeon]MBT4441405.1 radical SAM protein [archaeon]